MTSSIPNSDMEDFISSIKRLVSDPDAKREAPSTDKPTLFLLTPAHRVDAAEDAPAFRHAEGGLDLTVEPEMFDTDEDAAPIVAETEANSAAAPEAGSGPAMADEGEAETEDAARDAPAETARLSPLEQRIAELERAVGRADEQFEPDGSEPQEIHQPKLHFLERYRKVAEEKWAEAQGHAETEAETEAGADGPRAAGDDRPAFSTEPPEQDLAHMADEELAADIAEATGIDALAQTPEPAPEAPQDAAAETPREVPDAPDVPLDLGAVAMFMHRAPQPEPEAEAEAVPEPPAPGGEWVDPAAPPSIDDRDVDETAEYLPQAHGPQGGDIVEDDGEFLVDEEVLRALVGDIVRDELQGRLGERITRNVRRMVRQEIERALQMRNLK